MSVENIAEIISNNPRNIKISRIKHQCPLPICMIYPIEQENIGICKKCNEIMCKKHIFENTCAKCEKKVIEKLLVKNVWINAKNAGLHIVGYPTKV